MIVDLNFLYLGLFQIQIAWSHQTEQRHQSYCKCWQRQCQLEDHHSLSEPTACEKISPSDSSYVKRNFHLVNIPSEDTRSQAIVCGISSPQNSINVTKGEREREREREREKERRRGRMGWGSDRQKITMDSSLLVTTKLQECFLTHFQRWRWPLLDQMTPP